MVEGEELGLTTRSLPPIRTYRPHGQADRRLEFPGSCQEKTGRSPRGWDADYIEHLGRSFETQTYVYEQAVRPSRVGIGN